MHGSLIPLLAPCPDWLRVENGSILLVTELMEQTGEVPKGKERESQEK